MLISTSSRVVGEYHGNFLTKGRVPLSPCQCKIQDKQITTVVDGRLLSIRMSMANVLRAGTACLVISSGLVAANLGLFSEMNHLNGSSVRLGLLSQTL